MKITGVELHPSGSTAVCILSFRDPRRENPYNVKGIVGLDADEISPRFYGGSGDSKFYNMMLQKRDITIRAELNPNFTLEESFSELRDNMYRVISSSRSGLVEIQFKNLDEIVAIVSAHIVKMEAVHFSNTPELQLTFRCVDPMLKSATVVEFPVDAEEDTQIVLDGLSTAPHGFEATFVFDGSASRIRITDPMDDSWWFAIDFNSSIITPTTGDILTLSSEHKSKKAFITRAGIDTHVADMIVTYSKWPIIFPARENHFKVAEYVNPVDTGADASPSNIQWETLTYYPTYWGV